MAKLGTEVKSFRGATLVDTITGLTFEVDHAYEKNGERYFQIGDAKDGIKLKDNDNYMVVDKTDYILNGKVEDWLKTGDNNSYLDAIASKIFSPTGDENITMREVFTRSYKNIDENGNKVPAEVAIGIRYKEFQNEVGKLDKMLEARYGQKGLGSKKCVEARVDGLNHLIAKYDLGRDVLNYKNYMELGSYKEAVAKTNEEIKTNQTMSEKAKQELKIDSIVQEMDRVEAKRHAGKFFGGVGLSALGVVASAFSGPIGIVLIGAGLIQSLRGIFKTYENKMEKAYYKELKAELKGAEKTLKAVEKQENAKKEEIADLKVLDNKLSKAIDKQTEKINDLKNSLEKAKEKGNESTIKSLEGRINQMEKARDDKVAQKQEVESKLERLGSKSEKPVLIERLSNRKQDKIEQKKNDNSEKNKTEKSEEKKSKDKVEPKKDENKPEKLQKAEDKLDKANQKLEDIKEKMADTHISDNEKPTIDDLTEAIKDKMIAEKELDDVKEELENQNDNTETTENVGKDEDVNDNTENSDDDIEDKDEEDIDVDAEVTDDNIETENDMDVEISDDDTEETTDDIDIEEIDEFIDDNTVELDSDDKTDETVFVTIEDPQKPIDSAEPAESVEPVTPIEPVEPVEPVEHPTDTEIPIDNPEKSDEEKNKSDNVESPTEPVIEKSTKEQLQEMKVAHREEVFAQKLEKASLDCPNEGIQFNKIENGKLSIDTFSKNLTQADDGVNNTIEIKATNSNKPECLNSISSNGIEVIFSKDIINNRISLTGETPQDMIGKSIMSKADNELTEVRVTNPDGQIEIYSKNDELPNEIVEQIKDMIGDKAFEETAKDFEVQGDKLDADADVLEGKAKEEQEEKDEERKDDLKEENSDNLTTDEIEAEDSGQSNLEDSLVDENTDAFDVDSFADNTEALNDNQNNDDSYENDYDNSDDYE